MIERCSSAGAGPHPTPTPTVPEGPRRQQLLLRLPPRARSCPRMVRVMLDRHVREVEGSCGSWLASRNLTVHLRRTLFGGCGSDMTVSGRRHLPLLPSLPAAPLPRCLQPCCRRARLLAPVRYGLVLRNGRLLRLPETVGHRNAAGLDAWRLANDYDSDREENIWMGLCRAHPVGSISAWLTQPIGEALLRCDPRDTDGASLRSLKT
jgi:hypothetical protein